MFDTAVGNRTDRNARSIRIGVVVACAALALAATALAAGGSGKLRFANALFDEVDGVDGLESPCDVALAPGGRHVYATGCDDDSVVMMRRSLKSGKLSFIGLRRDGAGEIEGLEEPEDLIVSPDGHNVYVTSLDDSSVVVFKRNSKTGNLAFQQAKFDDTGPIEGLGGAESVAVSPDGDHVYVSADGEDNGIAIFKRIAGGKLKFVGAKDNGDAGVLGPWGMSFSPNGLHLYVALQGDEAKVAIYERNRSTGKLKLIDTINDGDGGADNLDDAFQLDLSPDGKFVYVAADDDGAITVFKRNPKTGKLKFVQVRIENAGAGPYFSRPFDVIVTPDGKNAYVTAYEDSAIVAFARDEQTGKLKWIGTRRDGVDGFDGLGGVWRLDGGNRGVVGAGYDDHAVASLKRVR